MRWGESGPKDDGAARRRLVDAAERCFKRYGVAKTTVEDVAVQASVSRATVYRYFDGRDALILGVLQRESRRFLKRLRRHMEDQPTMADAIVEGAMFTLDHVRRDANLGMLFTPETVGLTTHVEGAPEALFSMAEEIMQPLFERSEKTGELRAGMDLPDAAEFMLRMIVSLLTVKPPVERSQDEQRGFLRGFLLPPLLEESPSVDSGREPAVVAAVRS